MDRPLRPSRLMRPVELARCPTFWIGRAEVRPGTREVVTADQRRVLEPRVMQVLVALAEADGEILSRGDLNDLCWDGVAVSDHAMNRVISRLRALARETAAFEIETITKVGYRLTSAEPIVRRATPTEPAAVAPAPNLRAEKDLRPSGLGRRGVLVGGGLAMAAAAGVAGWRLSEAGRRDREVEALVDHAWAAIRRDREDETATAISNLRLAVEKAPDNARAWGLLALAYSWIEEQASSKDARAAGERTQDAVDRALDLDPRSEFALAARAWRIPAFGHWLEAEQAARAALAQHPRSPLLLNRLTSVLLEAGRLRDALPISASLQAQDLFSPMCWALRTTTLYDNGRLEEAAQALDQALRLYPRHPLVWFANLNFLTDIGRFAAARAFLEDRANRPIGPPDESWAVNGAVIAALETQRPTDVEDVLASLRKGVASGQYPFSRALVFMASVGRIDDAYPAIEAYYFGEGLRVAQRSTHALFHKRTAALRADARFRPLTAKLGLDAYWKAAGVTPPVA